MDSKDEKKAYPPPDIKDQTSTCLSPPPYSSHPASEPTQVLPSSIPQIYPPYPPTEVPPVTSPPNTGQIYSSYQSANGVTTIQVVEALPNFGSESQYVRCPNCGTQGFSKIDHKATTTTHMMALLLCCVILWPIVWLPYVCNSCQSTVHYCSHCNHYLGERKV